MSRWRAKSRCYSNPVLLIVFLLVLVVGGALLVACGDDTSSNTTEPVSTTSPAAEPDTTTAAATSTGEEITLRMVSFLPPTSSVVAGAQIFVDEVNERLAGQLKIDYVGGPEVIPSLDQPKAVADGAIDGAFTVVGYYTNLVPVAFLKVGCAITPMEQRDSGFYEKFNEVNEEAGLHYLGDYLCYSPFNFVLREPITGLDDFNGKLIRTGGIQTPLTEALGGKAQVMQLGDVFTALQTGVIDGASATFIEYFESGWYEAAPYFVEPGFYSTSAANVIVFNLDVWNGLPENIREQLTAISAELESEVYDLGMANVEHARTQALEGGAQSIELPAAEAEKFIDTSRDAIFDYVAGQPGVTDELLDEFRPLMGLGD